MNYLAPTLGLLVFLLGVSQPVFGQEVATSATASVEAVTSNAETHPALKETRVVAVMGADGVQRVELSGGEYYFDPNYIVFKVNRAAELKVRKAADATFFIPHNIIVKAPEAGIDFNIDLSKETQSIKFIPTKVGLYPMYCDKKAPFSKSHQEKGMEGIIEVVE